MGVFTYEAEFTSTIPPARLFKAFVLDGDNLIPKIAPQAIKQAEILEGDGGPGTIKKITFGEGKFYILLLRRKLGSQETYLFELILSIRRYASYNELQVSYVHGLIIHRQ